MTTDVRWGLGFIAVGLLTIWRRRRIASDSARRKETWMADYRDPDQIASSLAVFGWILVGMGLLILIFRPASW